jgi:hypothetical protein
LSKLANVTVCPLARREFDRCQKGVECSHRAWQRLQGLGKNWRREFDRRSRCSS